MLLKTAGKGSNYVPGNVGLLDCFGGGQGTKELTMVHGRFFIADFDFCDAGLECVLKLKQSGIVFAGGGHGLSLLSYLHARREKARGFQEGKEKGTDLSLWG